MTLFRKRIALAAGIAACSLLTLSRLGGHVERRASVEGSIEPEAIPIVSPTGGTVSRVLARRGDHVAAGQVLLTFETTELDTQLSRAHAALNELPPHFLEQTASLIARIPPTTMARLVRSNPEILAAEQAYASALAESEHDPSLAAKARLKRSERIRAEAYRIAGGLQPRGLSSLRKLQDEGREAVRWLEAQREKFEVRAPSDGVIELLDLQPGSMVPPLSPIALIDLTGRFTVRARVPGQMQPGQQIAVELPGGNRVPARVASCENHRLRASVAILSGAPQAEQVVRIFF